MALHCVPLPPGTLKINAHGASVRIPTAHNNNTGMTAIYRDSVAGLRLMTIGCIQELTPLGNESWVIFIALKRAFSEGYHDVILDTDNLRAYHTIKNLKTGAPADVYDIASQIDIRIKDRRWFCTVAFVLSARNRVARYAARIALKMGDMLYTMDRPLPGVEELLEWDMEMGLDHAAFVDVMLPNNAPDSAEYNGVVVLLDQIEMLGIGMVGGPPGEVMNVESDEDQLDLDGAVEEHFQVGIVADAGIMLIGDVPLVDVD